MNTRKYFTPVASPAIAPASRLAESVEDFATRAGLGRTTVERSRYAAGNKRPGRVKDTGM